MFPLNYCASLFHLDQFPDEAFGPRMRSMYDLLVQIGIPSSIDGATVLHAGLAYVNPAVDLESESGKRGPIGVNTTISGVSGCGKTVAKNYAYDSMSRFHAAYLKDDPNEIALYEDADVAACDDDDEEDSEQRPNDKGGSRHPFESHIQFSGTMEAMIDSLVSYPVMNEIDDEFTALQSGSITRHGNTRVKLYDGQTFSVALKSSGRGNIVGPRVTSGRWTQPHILREFDKKHGARYRNSGLGAREIFVEYDGGPRVIRLLKADTPLLNEACMEFLRDTVRLVRLRLQRPVVKFRADGLRATEMVVQRYQQRGARGGDLEPLPEHVARQPEIIQRIAAGLHSFEGWAGDISGETVERALRIGEFFTEHYKRRFAPKPKVPREFVEAGHLEQCLRHYVQKTGQLAIKRSHLRDYAPNIGMTKAALDRALTVLCSSDRARIVIGSDKAAWVVLNAAYFPVPHSLTSYR